MAESSKLPNFDSLQELTNFFDDNDMGDYWESMPEANFDVAIKKKTHLIILEEALENRLAKVAKDKNVSSEALIKVWIEEKLSHAS